MWLTELILRVWKSKQPNSQLLPAGMKDKIDTESFKEFAKLRELRISHRDLDDLIDRLSNDPLVDQLRIRRLKKRRLILKDMISKMESSLIPDLDA